MSDAGDHLTHAWALVSHVCRACFARVLFRQDDAGVAIYRCSNCGIERAGAEPSAVCACGLLRPDGSDARVRCRSNYARTPEYPGEVEAVALVS
ncbi:hypothetical protein [Burkholderia pseudomallei]|uniref:hypothetical protein n=1 Tax=Burkholderia pseudomallei TaxID=28450 RepID=UPI00052A88FA|nr:hypothetical protein [Burkholderia pseudomallei]AIV48348.1 hypothetical protein X988_2248 [Burkholderia pseudomallei TSV 48]